MKCKDCSYKMKHIHKSNCPMCEKCKGCSEKLMSCCCIEGE